MTVVFNDDLSQEAKDILYTLTNQEKSIDYKRLGFKRDKYLEFAFRDFKFLKEWLRDIYFREFTMKEAERKQDEFDSIVNKSEKYKPKKPKYKNERLMLLENIKKSYGGRE